MKHSRVLMDAWFSAGVALSTATQLRRGGLPVGPGELLLVSWLGMMLLSWAARPRVASPPMARAVLWFWALSLPTLMAGMLAGMWMGHGPAAGFAYDLVAFLLVAALFTVFTCTPGLYERAGNCVKLVCVMAVVPQLLMLLLVPRGAGLGPIQPWYFGVRFRGWSENPNQLALAMVAVPFCTLILASTAASRRRRFAYGGLTLGAILIGVASLSDAITVAWAAGFGIAAVGGWFFAVRRPVYSFPRALFLKLLVPGGVLALLVLGGPVLYSVVGGLVYELYSLGGQGSVRVQLWMMGLEAMAASPLVGSGPGPLSGHTAPFEGAESHNTFVDWGASTGVVGLTLYTILFSVAALRAIRRGQVLPVAGIVALLAFSMLHFVPRHPTFWFYLVAFGTLPDVVSRAAARVKAGNGDLLAAQRGG